MSGIEKRKTRHKRLATIVLLGCLSLRAHAAPGAFEIVASPASTIKIDGDSTARKFSAVAKAIAVRGSAMPRTGGKSAVNGELPWLPQDLELSLPVRSLSSGERTLDRHMQENLKAEKNPTIRLKITHFDFGSSAGAKVTTVNATGELTVAGVTKPISLEPTVEIEQQKVTIKGKKRVLMSDYGITPPVLMMGTLKTRDEIDVSYDVELLPRPPTKDR